MTLYSDLGSRSINEDAVGAYEKDNTACYILCDGLGGHGMGDVASNLVVQVFRDRFENGKLGTNPGTELERTFRAAQDILMAEQMARRAENKMKTTAVACVVDGKKAYIAHVGDSRVYVFSKNRILKRTLDHSIPQMLAISGEILEKDIRNHPDRNMLLRVLGVEWEKDMFDMMKPIPLRKIQAILLCSDGFWELINDDTICKFLAASKSVEEWMEKMKSEVKANGLGKDMDNNSAIAIWF